MHANEALNCQFLRNLHSMQFSLIYNKVVLSFFLVILARSNFDHYAKVFV